MLRTLKGIFSILRFFAPSDSRFQIVVSQPECCPTNHTSMESLFIQLTDEVYISIEKKIDTYDWFCGPGSHMISTIILYLL